VAQDLAIIYVLLVKLGMKHNVNVLHVHQIVKLVIIMDQELVIIIVYLKIVVMDYVHNLQMDIHVFVNSLV